MLKELPTCQTNPAFGEGFAIEGRRPRMIYPTSQPYEKGPGSRDFGGTRKEERVEDPDIIVLQTDHVPLFPLDKKYLAGGGFRELSWVEKKREAEALHRHFVVFPSFDRDTRYALQQELRYVLEEEAVEIFKRMPVCIVSPDEGIFFQAAGRTLASLKRGEGMDYEADSNVQVFTAYDDNKTKRFTEDMLRIVHTAVKDVDLVINTSAGMGILNGRAGCVFVSEDFDEANELVKDLIASNEVTDESLRKIVLPYFELK